MSVRRTASSGRGARHSPLPAVSATLKLGVRGLHQVGATRRPRYTCQAAIRAVCTASGGFTGARGLFSQGFSWFAAPRAAVGGRASTCDAARLIAGPSPSPTVEAVARRPGRGRSPLWAGSSNTAGCSRRPYRRARSPDGAGSRAASSAGPSLPRVRQRWSAASPGSGRGAQSRRWP